MWLFSVPKLHPHSEEEPDHSPEGRREFNDNDNVRREFNDNEDCSREFNDNKDCLCMFHITYCITVNPNVRSGQWVTYCFSLL